MRALAIALVVLLSPLMARAQTTPSPPTSSLAESAPLPEPPAAELPFRHVAVISIGAVAGVIVVNMVTGGLIMPILAAGVVETPAALPGTAAAGAVATAAGAAAPAMAMAGVDYLSTASEAALVAVGAVVGGYVGNWLYYRY